MNKAREHELATKVSEYISKTGKPITWGWAPGQYPEPKTHREKTGKHTKYSTGLYFDSISNEGLFEEAVIFHLHGDVEYNPRDDLVRFALDNWDEIFGDFQGIREWTTGEA